MAVLLALALAACGSPEEQAKRFYDHGQELLAQHENARAGIEFRNALRKKADFLPAWVALAKVEETDRHWGALIPILKRILELQPKDNETRLKLARLVFLSGALDEALNLANAVEDENKQNADALALKAAILFRLKDSNGGVREAEAALKIDPKNAGAIGVIAADRLARGDAKGALAMLDNSPTNDPNDLGLQLFKLKVFEQIQDLKQVELLLRKLAERYPDEVEFRRQLVRLYVFQRRGDDAEKEARAIVAAHPSDSKIFLEYVSLLNTLKGAPVARKELVSRINAGGDVFSYQVALAQFDFANGNLEDSRALLNRLISEDSAPEHVLTAQVSLAQIYLNKKMAEPAEALVTDILRKDNRNTAGLKLRASLRLDRGEFEPAINDLRQALNDQPRATDLMLLLALAYERSGSVDLAEKEFADATKASNFDAAVGLDYIAFLERRGSVEHAEDVLNELANRWPKNKRILSALAQLRLARGNWVGAQEVADSIRRAGDEQGVADQVLGAALAGQNKLQESIGALQSAYTAAPGSVQPMLSLVTVYMRAQQPDRAVSFLQSVIKANPANAEAYVLLGSIALTNKAPDDALKNFMTAIEKQPKNPVGYQAAARFYIGQKKFDEAEKLVRAGIKEQPANTVLKLTLTSILEQTGKVDAAISEYEALLADDPSSLIAANNLASLLADHRSDKESLDRSRTLAASLRKSPVPQFKDTLGWVDYRQGDYKSAVPLLEEAVAALPNLPVVHYHLGMSYIAIGEPAKATEQLQLASKATADGDLKGKIEAAMKNTAR
jgi:tetratricopeptide (TPR) repeat protein